LVVSAPTGIDVRTVQLLGAEAQHLDQAGLVQHRIRVGRAGQAGDAARHRGVHLGFQGGRYSKPGSRSRADRSTRPGQTTRPPASMTWSA
jgi:hypothetical protein